MAEHYNNNEKLIFINNLKLLRVIFGLTQADLAAQINVSEKVISRIETINYNLSPYWVEAIADYFNVSEKDLFREDFDNLYLTPKKKKELGKMVMSDIEFFLLKKNMLNSAVIKTLYPPKRDFVDVENEMDEFKILSIFDLVVYIPLIPPRDLILLTFRVSGKTKGNEKYLLGILNLLYKTIPNSNAKKYADYLSCFNVQSNLDLNIHPAAEELNKENFMDKYPFFYKHFDDYNDYLNCQNDYNKRLKSYQEWMRSDNAILKF